MSAPVQFVVIAKEPVPGRVKTRLCPPCSMDEAAAIAEASLHATLVAVQVASQAGATRPVLALEGRPGPWMPDGFDVVAQSDGGLDQRLTAAFAHCFAADPARPVVLIGMDTPQVTPRRLHTAAAALGTHDAVLGPAPDGGYWLIGLGHLAPGAITGVPMSADDTFDRQLGRLRARGYRVALTESLVDVDDIADARHVAGLLPGSRFAGAVLASLGPVGSRSA